MTGMLIKILPNGDKEFQAYNKNDTPSWEVLFKLVGNYIERVRVKYEGKMRDAYLDEEGLIRNPPLEINPYAYELIKAGGNAYQNYYVGPIVIWVPDPKVKKSV